MPRLQDPTLLKNLALIDGQWCPATDGSTLPVHNPANGELVGHVPNMGAEQTQTAIEAADRAFASWKLRTAEDRANLLKRWHALMLANADDLALLMTAEQGKPLAEAKGEIAYAASYIEWFAEEARRIYGEVIPSPWPDKRIVVTREPVGVCAAITPWNFPSAMITRKVAPALAAGCTIIVKPAEQTPLSALAMAELAQRAGIPAGVFNVITGDARAIGGVLTASPAVRKLTFTGSTEVGRCAGGAVRAHAQAHVAGVGGQRALHRVQRRRPGRSRGRGHGLQIPQHRPDLCVQQPLPGARRRV
jgi:succinate-semialdehyde dehydrogenase/glutarate-semialdehyde dehydrogenase